MTWRPGSEGGGVKVEQYENATLYCGDCREIFQELPAVQAVVTDPPYGVHYVTKRRKVLERPEAIENDDEAPLWCVPMIAEKVEDGGAVYICTQFSVFAEWQGAMASAGLKLKTPIVWDKRLHTAGDLTGDYGNQVELILFGHKGRHTLRNGRQANLWSISRPPAGEHPTPKPVELMSRCIANSTDQGAIILDPFMGSGTTGVAALQQGRRFIGVEICEKYFDIARRRVEAADCQLNMFAGGVLMIYAIDFDGTLCVDAYPAIGEPREGVISAVLDAQRAGDRFILWTCRIGERLEEAVAWSAAQGLTFDAVNDNLPDMIELYGNNCRKVFADGYIDDRNVRDLLGVEI